MDIPPTTRARKNSIDFSCITERIQSEYMKTNKTYEPYRLENVMILQYTEIRKLEKNNDFVLVTPKTKVTPRDQLVLVTDSDDIMFFHSENNLVTGYYEGVHNGENYRDTLFFDHSTNTVIVARRNFAANSQAKCNLSPAFSTVSTAGNKSASNAKLSMHGITILDEDESNVKQYIGTAIEKIDESLEKIQLEKAKETKKTKPRTRKKVLTPMVENESV